MASDTQTNKQTNTHTYYITRARARIQVNKYFHVSRYYYYYYSQEHDAPSTFLGVTANVLVRSIDRTEDFDIPFLFISCLYLVNQ